MRRLAAGAVLLVAAACGGPETGSEEDLAGRIDALNVPSSMVRLGDSYVEECPASCPLYVRWYDATVPSDALGTELRSRIEASGVDVNDVSAGPMFYATEEGYGYFVVLDPAMIANNASAPPGSDVEISVQVNGR